MGFPLKALISVTRNKQFLLQIASEENRLVISPELLGEPLKKCVPFFCCFSNLSIAKKILQKARERQEGIKKVETPNPP